MAAVNAALEAFGKANAIDLAPVRVNVIAPGLVHTPAYAGLPEEIRQGMYDGYAQSVPAGRVGTPADVASAALFLMTNSHVTGTAWTSMAASRSSEAASSHEGKASPEARSERASPRVLVPRGLAQRVGLS